MGGVSLVVHGPAMRGWYSLKLQGKLIPGPNVDPDIWILIRKVEWAGDTVRCDIDARSMEAMIEEIDEVGLQAELKGLGMPIVVEAELGSADVARFWRIALANYVAADRPDIQAAVSHLRGAMAIPTKGGRSSSAWGGTPRTPRGPSSK